MKGIGFYGQDFFYINNDSTLIKENLLRVLLTSPGERPMSSFGCKLKDYLLEQSTIFIQDAETEIKKAINKWEPRVTVNSISIEILEETTAKIELSCTIKETYEELNLNAILRL